MNTYRESLRAQLMEAYGRIVYTSTTQMKHAQRLGRKKNLLQVVGIVLSAITTGGLFATLTWDERWIAFISALVSTAVLVISLILKDNRWDERINQHHDVGEDLREIRDKYISLMTDMDNMPESEVALKRDELQQAASVVLRTAPYTSRKSYQEAQHALKEEEEQYFSDRELDQILPKHLRQSQQELAE